MKIKFLSKMMTLIYLFYEFGNGNLKVTTYLDDDGCWLGKVLIESTKENAKDDLELADFYTQAYIKNIK